MPPFSTFVSTRRVHRRSSSSARHPYPLATPILVFPSPSSSSRAGQAEREQSHRRRRFRPPLAIPPRFPAPRAAQLHPAPPPLLPRTHLSFSSAESTTSTPADIVGRPDLRPLPSSSTFRPSSVRFECMVSFPATSSPSPTPFPSVPRAAGVGTPPWQSCLRRAPAVGRPCAGPGSAAERPAPPGCAGRRPTPPSVGWPRRWRGRRATSVPTVAGHGVREQGLGWASHRPVGPNCQPLFRV